MFPSASLSSVCSIRPNDQFNPTLLAKFKYPEQAKYLVDETESKSTVGIMIN